MTIDNTLLHDTSQKNTPLIFALGSPVFIIDTYICFILLSQNLILPISKGDQFFLSASCPGQVASKNPSLS